jgi:hypothetical protein
MPAMLGSKIALMCRSGHFNHQGIAILLPSNIPLNIYRLFCNTEGKMERKGLIHWGLTALLSGSLVMLGANAAGPCHAAQIAASIEYDFVARPAGLSSDFDVRRAPPSSFSRSKQ